MDYRINRDFSIRVRIDVKPDHIAESLKLTNGILADLPASLYKSLDFKTTSAIVGSIFVEALAHQTKGIVNPIEKGHPDIIPQNAAGATEAQLRNYPEGLEIKATVGNVENGANLRAGQKRVGNIVGITWQAHHREVKELMGLTWDFAQTEASFNYPEITGVFYSAKLETLDWGKISGTTGRNTKVTGLTASGKHKMARGWVAIVNDPEYLELFCKVLRVARIKSTALAKAQ